MKAVFVLIFFVMAGILPLWSKEFFVSPSGNDKGSGTQSSPFKTIQRGVNALKPGDILTVMPGTYHESVQWRFDGDAVKKTLVRAQYPGTVLLRGDREVTGFKAVPGKKNCYEISLPAVPEGVNERDTYTMYTRDDTILENPYAAYGCYTYDANAKKLYIATSDGKAPEKHTISVSDLPGFGLIVSPKTKIRKVQNVIIDGLSATGFSSKGAAAHSSLWGFAIWNAENCIIRNCTSFINEGGLTMYFADKSRIENCRAFGNGTTKHVSAGNIVIFNSKNSVIDNCLSFKSVTYGLRFYGTNSCNTISNSISIGDYRGSIWIKPDDKTNKLFQCYSPSMVACFRTENCVYGVNDYDRTGKGGPTSLVLKKNHVVTFPDDFADPWNFDLRLQKNSTLKKGFTGTSVYFVAPGGNDNADGRSVKTAWKTLKNVPSGATVYLVPGVYSGDMTLSADNVTLAGRGQQAPILIKGGKNGIVITGKNNRIKRLSFAEQKESAILVSAPSLLVECCGFARQQDAVLAAGQSKVEITHCAFAPDVKNIVKGEKVSGSFTHNITPCHVEKLFAFSNKVSQEPFPNSGKGDFTGGKTEICVSSDGLPIGPYFFLYEPQGAKSDYVTALVPSSTTGEIIWSMNTSPVGTQVSVAEKSGQNRKNFASFTSDSALHTVSLTDLKPDTEYRFFLSYRPRMHYVLSNRYLPAGLNPSKLKNARSQEYTFRTLPADRAPRTWYVSAKGNDQNSGTAQAPFRTINRAALATAPGDTVLIGTGLYSESVFVPVSGKASAPVTYKAAPGAEVWLEGANRRFCRAFVLFGKQHLRFDGLRFKEYGTAFPNSSGIFFAQGSNDLKISRCFGDARGPGYAPALIHLRSTRNVKLEQSVILGGMTTLTIVESTGVEILNNVMKKASIWTIVFHSSSAKNKVLFANNIVTDNSRGKTFQAPLKVSLLENLTEKNNLYFMRFPRELRTIVEYMTPQGKLQQLTLDAFYKETRQQGRSFFADPGIKVLSNQLCWKTPQERLADMKKPVAFQRNNNNVEDARNPEDMTAYRHWSFGDFFNEKLFKEKGIGLNPALFKDMAVTAAPGYDKR